MGNDTGKQVGSVAIQRLHEHVVLLAMRFKASDDGFLRTATVIKRLYGFNARGFIRYNGLEVISVFMRLKHIQLNRSFVLLFHAGSDKNHAAWRFPFLCFPSALKVADFVIELTIAAVVQRVPLIRQSGQKAR